MIIVNTTFVLHHTIAEEMKGWIKDTYLASAVRSGATADTALLTKVLGAADPETTTYAMHIYFDDLATARKWNEGVGGRLRSILNDRWGERALTFHTYLEVTE